MIIYMPLLVFQVFLLKFHLIRHLMCCGAQQDAFSSFSQGMGSKHGSYFILKSSLLPDAETVV